MGVDARISSQGWTLAQWREAYRNGAWTPAQLLPAVLAAQQDGDTAWIARVTPQALDAQLQALAQRLDAVGGDMTRLPLYGVPFAVKDNIDAEGWSTTAACPAFAYAAHEDATVVARLRAAGAILVGKTNLDQFATGLVGTRSPYGPVPNTFDPRYVSGGSSSGSASVTARGIVPFALGTDTAGSGRVPAGLNNIVGLKPTKGWLSTQGVVPACRTLDCVSVFALTVEDAWLVADVAGGYDGQDPYSRRADAAQAGRGAAWPVKLAVPDQLEFFGDAQAEAAFAQAVSRWQAMGASIETVDYAPFRALADLLYQGPWVAERFEAVRSLWERAPDAIDPVVRSIVEQAQRFSAADTFRAEYARAALVRQIQDALQGFDAMLVPTAPTAYTIAQLQQEPLLLNSRLGYYTNFVNFADMSALALPASLRADGLPSGITLIAGAWQDAALAALGRRWQADIGLPLGATGRMAVAAGQGASTADGISDDASAMALAAPAGTAGAERASADSAALGATESAASAGATDAASAAAAPDDAVVLAVVGAHLRGMPLNHQLTSRHAQFIEQTATAPVYRLYALANTGIPKPGLCREDDGASIVLELWSLSPAAFGAFTAEVPAPLGIGTVRLQDGREVKGFICEPAGLRDAIDITEFGGWRAYLASRATAASSGETAHV